MAAVNILALSETIRFAQRRFFYAWSGVFLRVTSIKMILT